MKKITATSGDFLFENLSPVHFESREWGSLHGIIDAVFINRIMARIAINGFGRIGRSTLRAAWGRRKFNVVAINDLADAPTLAHLLTYDTNYRKWNVLVKAGKDFITVGRTKIPILSEKDPEKLPWKQMRLDVVIESTGRFTNAESAGAHIRAGAKKVLISAPAKGGGVPTIVKGVNDSELKKGTTIVNNASCTTNCTAPVMAILDEAFGIEKAMLSTVHGYTADQNIVDGPHRDLRRARAAAQNIIPTSTGAAKATAETLPQMGSVFDGIAIRVPVSTGSLIDVTMVMKKDVTVEEVNNAFRKAVKVPRYKGIVAVTDEPLVSSDFIGDPHSAVIDLALTRVVGGNLVKVCAWYDNEWGYANRLVETALQLS